MSWFKWCRNPVTTTLDCSVGSKLTCALNLFLPISFQKDSEIVWGVRNVPSAAQDFFFVRSTGRNLKEWRDNLTVLEHEPSWVRTTHLHTQCRAFVSRTGINALVMAMAVKLVCTPKSQHISTSSKEETNFNRRCGTWIMNRRPTLKYINCLIVQFVDTKALHTPKDEL